MNKSEFISNLKNIKCALLDLDGTLYLGDNLIPKAETALDIMREFGIKLVFLTNNSSKTADEYKQKLNALGLFREGDKIFTSGEATARYLLKNNLKDRVYVLAREEIKRDFFDLGIDVVESDARVAVLCYDTTLTYKKICAFNEQIALGAKYIASHNDNVCPTDGVFAPDAGSFIAMFNISCGKTPDIVIGKPNRFMGEIIMDELCLNPSQVMMVGDRLYTDIAFGKNCDFLTALVLSGETTLEMANESKHKADCIFENIYEIAKNLV